ncbi:MAG: BlaI/MecI/CopY family transcriptional regulator [Peptostreptococcaceae bacterium]|nr:BlaI/MecI/CopY family transcriptional regulator [Peptostreptococcaceae bacterium]
MKKTIEKISNRERDVMMVFWKEDRPLTASGIVEADPSLSINTVQLAVKNLMKKGYIEVAQIVYSGTVLSRSYRYLIRSEEYAAAQLQEMKMTTLNFSTLNLIERLIDESDESLLDTLEQLVRTKKENADRPARKRSASSKKSAVKD